MRGCLSYGILPARQPLDGRTGWARPLSFFRELSRVTFAQNPRFKLLLLKQAACDDGLLRDMHAGYLKRLRELKRQVDPEHVLASKLLVRLLPD
jgi:hypothetical protein